MTQKTVDLPKFGRAAEVRSTSFNQADNTIDVVWTTGAPVRRYSYREGIHYNETLEVSQEAVRLDRLNAGAAFLNTHSDSNLSDVIGSVVPGSARIEGGKGIAKIRLSSAPEDAAIVGKIRDGIIRNISVGYAIHRVERTVTTEGADEDWLVVDWEPMEISAVPIPADAGSQIRSDGNTRPCQVIDVKPGGNTNADIRKRMLARQARAMGDEDIVIRTARNELAGGTVSADFLNAMLIARAAAEASSDPAEAALAAFRSIGDVDDEDRGAAYAAAFIFASTGLGA